MTGQSRFVVATKVRLAALVGAALLSMLEWTVDGRNLTAFGAGIAFALAGACETYLLIARPERQWYEGRAAAESAKTTAWRYAVGGDPFGIDDADAPEPDSLLIERYKEVLGELGNVGVDSTVMNQDQITPQMRSLRARPRSERIKAYLSSRIDNQQVWYAKRAKLNEALAHRWTILIIASEVFGLILVFGRAAWSWEVDIAAPIAAAAAAAAAWVQSRQYQTLSRAYSITANELVSLRTEAGLVVTESAWKEFVQDAEAAMSREHTLWKASRGIAGKG
jgi:hypothetical protein